MTDAVGPGPDVPGPGQGDSWDGVAVVVAGLDSAGFAAVDNLLHLGARVTVLDEVARADRSAAEVERVTLLEILGAELVLGPGSTASLPPGAALVVLTPGAPDSLAEEAASRGVPVWGEVELAWRLRDPATAPPWLLVAGGEGTDEAVALLGAMLAAGERSVQVAGAGGLPIVEVVMDPTPYDVLAVGLSAAQLARVTSVRAHSAAVLHVDEAASAAALGRAFEGVEVACVYNVADPATEELVADAEVVEGARAIGVTVGTPGLSMVGLVEDVLADRAFVPDRRTTAAELATLADLASDEPAYLERVLAAAALARAFGVEPVAVRDALRGLRDSGRD